MTDAAYANDAPSPTGNEARRGAITRLTQAVLAHKRAVVIFWVILTLAGIASAGSATKLLRGEPSLPPRLAAEAEA
ncbi:MAG: hypothetical protein QOE38_3027 [Thermoleophilaceae bacterium]|nr:hypothetical protein [Thermoleophilaceae bacterium]